MSKKAQKNLEKSARIQAAKEADSKEKVCMTFSEPKFYTDLSKPIFEAGKVYELEGADWIQRWIKRGGVIVEKDSKAISGAKPESESVGGLMSPVGADLSPPVKEETPPAPEKESDEYMASAKSLNGEEENDLE